MATNGADVIAYKDNIKYVIQVKFYNNPVGNKAVQEVVGAIGMYKANKGIVVTNSTFTPSAVELAQANNIELVDGARIEEYKKEIIDNIDNKEIQGTEELDIEHILYLWNISISELEKLKGTEIVGMDMIIILGIALATGYKGQCDKIAIKNFIKLLPKYSNSNKLVEGLFEEFDIEDDEDMDSLLMMIETGVFQKFLMNEFKESSQIPDNGISDIDKYLIIYMNNTQDMGTTEQVIALSKCIGLDIDDTIQLIREYKEKLSD